jgi:hypothetical protein
VSDLDGEEPPGARYALELMLAAVDELDPGASDEVHDGSRNQEFARSGDSLHSLSEMHSDAGHVLATQLDPPVCRPAFR